MKHGNRAAIPVAMTSTAISTVLAIVTVFQGGGI